jgi:hypothetical protein
VFRAASATTVISGFIKMMKPKYYHGSSKMGERIRISGRKFILHYIILVLSGVVIDRSGKYISLIF